MDRARKAAIGRQLTYGTDTEVHNYSYRPDYYFIGETKIIRSWTSPNKVESKFIEREGLPMGFELELERRPYSGVSDADVIYEINKHIGYQYYVDRFGRYDNDVTEQIDDIVPQLVIAKADGSLNNGVEFVTQPMTLGVHQGVGYNFDNYNDVYQGYHRSTTGMHVHIPKGAFSNQELYLWLFLMEMIGNVRTDHRNWTSLLSLIGQRGFNNWARFNMPAYSSVKHSLAQVSIDRLDTDGQRYKFLNFQPRSTIELRFFKANMLKSRIVKNLEFVDSTYEYIKMLTNQDYNPHNLLLKANNFKSYWDFVTDSSNEDKYSNYINYLNPYLDRVVDVNNAYNIHSDEDTDALNNIIQDEIREDVA